MAQLKKYTLADLETISEGDLRGLSSSQLHTIDTGDTLFSHVLYLSRVCSVHGLGTKEAYTTPDTEVGLDFFVKRWQFLAAQFPTGLSIGFFDREGTTFEKEIAVPQPNGDVIRAEMGYPIAAADHIFISGAVETLQTHQQRGLNVLMTGQSGVARGHFTEKQMAGELTGVLRNAARQGVIFDAVLYCPLFP